MRTMTCWVMLAATVSLSACGSSGSDEAATPERTVTVIEKTKTVTEPSKPAPKPKAAKKTAEPEPVDDSAGGGQIRVPDVVGKDHQLAQDTMQAAGLYSLDEKDATGQGRLLLYDRNWTTVAQSPPAGSLVSPDTTITLSAKKDGE